MAMLILFLLMIAAAVILPLYVRACGKKRLAAQADEALRQNGVDGADAGAVYGLSQKLIYSEPMDKATGHLLLKMAAEGRHPKAMFEWGEALEGTSRGSPIVKGVAVDRRKSFYWTRLAMEQSSDRAVKAEATRRMGSKYADGTGVSEDMGKAIKCWREAAAMGDQLAVKLLNKFG
jgi:TPR repeat protein